MTSQPIPEALRRAVADDLPPVRPLPPVWRRTLLVASVAAIVLAVAVAAFSLRDDLGSMPGWIGWGGTLLQLAAGVLLAGLALREAVPGRAVPGTWVAAALASGLTLQIAVGVATWMVSPGPPFQWSAAGAGVSCMRHDLAFALPAFAVTLWLILRALPLRPAVAGMLGGAGTGIAADAVGHLLCPMSDLRHVVVWHSGAILLMTACGGLIGLLIGRLARRA